MIDDVQEGKNWKADKKKKKRLIMGILIGIVILALGILIGFRLGGSSISEQDLQNISEQDFPGITEEISKSLVIIKFLYGNQQIPICTGFIVDKRGYILTAKHCYDEIMKEYNKDQSPNISVEELISKLGMIEFAEDLQNNKSVKIESIENQDLNRKDILLLKIIDSADIKLIPIEIAKKEEVKFGMDVGYLGYVSIEDPITAVQLFVGKGTLSNPKTNLKGQTVPFYTISAVITSGYSGGPVFISKSGKIIGILKSELSGPQGKVGIVLVSPVHEVPEIIDKLE